MILELLFVTYIRIFFGHCHVAFPYKEPLSFLSRFAQNVTVSCFSDSFVQKTTQQKRVSAEASLRRTGGKMAAVMFRVIPSFYTKLFKKEPVYFCKHIWKMNCEQRILYFLPRWWDVLPTQLHISHYTTWKRWWASKEVGYNLLHLSTRGLFVYIIHVSIQWKSVCIEWATVW